MKTITYQQEYQKSIQHPEEFWREKAMQLDWFEAPQKILTTDKHGIQHWFSDAKMNTCYLALDTHVKAGRGNQLALIYDSPVTNKQEKITYKELLEKTKQTAGMIQSTGTQSGDCVIIYMPMIPQAVISMLACARLGAIHSVVFGGFAAHELAKRIDDAKPKLILSATCGIEIKKVIPYQPILNKALKQAAHKPKHCIIYEREMQKAELKAPRDLHWQKTLINSPKVDCVPVAGNDILYILYTSGTTGQPKGITRENAGHAVALKYSMDIIYDTHAGEVFFSASDIGWIVGHSYIVYGPLLQGCTTILYEGKPVMTPDPGSFWRVISEHKVKSLFTAPTAFRAIKKEDPEANYTKDYNLSSLKAIFAAGERLDPPTYHWLENNLKAPIIDHWWQTETGWAIASNFLGIELLPTKAGSSTKIVPGYDVRILNEKGAELAPNNKGSIAIKLPMPPSSLTTIWGSVERFRENYLSTYPGYYLSGDGGYIDEDGYLFVLGRMDDVINIAGHRLSTGEMEEIIGQHEAVAECAVIGVNDNLKGQIPIGFVVLKNNANIKETDLIVTLAKLVREKIGPIACYQNTYVVPHLPKTRSGKILRKTMRKIVNHENYDIPSTIDNPASLSEIKKAFQK